MKQYLYLFITVVCLYTTNSFGQHNNELFVKGGLYIEQGAEVYVWGDVHIDGTDGEIINDGKLELEGNFYKAPGTLYTDTGLGELAFNNDDINTSESLMLSGDMTGDNALSNLTINNSSPGGSFSIAGNVEITGALNITDGIFRTDNTGHGAYGEAYRYELFISNPDPNALNLGPNSYIEGRLRRTVSSGNSYLFPIGVEPGSLNEPAPMEMFFNIVPPGFNVLTYFNHRLSSPDEPGVACDNTYLKIDCLLGRWVTEPSGLPSTYSYDIELLPGNDFFNLCPITAPTYRVMLENTPAGDCSDSDHAADDLLSMSYFELAAMGTVLDIELDRFWAIIEDEAIRLNWTTISETNNAGFDLERSTDGQNFEKIAWIPGQINSSTSVDYTHKDIDVIRDVVYYYRLKAIDLGGEHDYSPVITASLAGFEGLDVQVYPNPLKAGEQLSFMSVNNGNLSLQIFDESLRLVKSRDFQTLKGEIISTELPANLVAGIYTVLLTDDSYSRRTRLMIVN